jgi:hypothetical protein
MADHAKGEPDENEQEQSGDQIPVEIVEVEALDHADAR